MKIIILDYADGKVKIIDDLDKNIQTEEVELLIYEKYGLSTSNIEYMIVPDLQIETLK